jgi:hypothetical protein
MVLGKEVLPSRRYGMEDTSPPRELPNPGYGDYESYKNQREIEVRLKKMAD